MSEYGDFVETVKRPPQVQNPPRSGGSRLPATTWPASRKRAIDEKDPGVMRSKNKTREEWVGLGRRHGEDEADRRGETGEEKENRARRAMGYWAWEWDGKPAGDGEKYRVEFGYGTEGELAGVLRGGPDPKHGKDKP